MRTNSLFLAFILLTLLLCGTAESHQPHDAVNSLSISPNYAQDKSFFVLLGPGAEFVLRGVRLLTSNDAGMTFDAIEDPISTEDLRFIKYSPSFKQDATLFASVYDKGLYKSVDGGMTWQQLDIGIATNDSVSALGISADFVIDGTVFIGTQKGWMLRSIDFGTSWQVINSGVLSRSEVTDVEISPEVALDNTIFYATLESGGYKSNDRGLTWNVMVDPSAQLKISSLALAPRFFNNQIVFASTFNKGVFRSTDGGRSWNIINNGLPELFVTDIETTEDGMVFVATKQSGIFRSNNGGRQWQAINNGFDLNNLSSQTDIHFRDIVASYDYKTSKTIFAATFEGLYFSDNGGDQWQQLIIMPQTITRAIALSPSFAQDQTIFANTYGGGVIKSINGGLDWSGVNRNGMQNAFPHPLVVSPAFSVDYTLMIGVYFGVGKSYEAGNSWSFSNLAGYSRELGISPDFANDGTVMSISRDFGIGFGIYRSKDHGATWHEANIGFPSLKLRDVVFSPDYANDRTVFAGVDGFGLYRSGDGGDSWQPSNNGIEQATVNTIAISSNFTNDGTVFIGTDGEGILKSTDGGFSWSPSNTGMDYKTISNLGMSPGYFQDGTIFAAVSNGGIFKSIDGGVSWSKSDTGLMPNIIAQVALSPNFSQDNTVYVGSYAGIFKSTDGGVNWENSLNYNQYDDSSYINEYTGIWDSVSISSAVFSHLTYSNTPGSSVRFSFQGSKLTWLASKGPEHGIATISLDGNFMVDIDLYSPIKSISVPVYQINGLAPGIHAFTIEVTGMANPNSLGAYVTLDAFDINQ